MPALDIGDEAFDLLFYAYKKNRWNWLRDGLYRRSVPRKYGKHNKGKPKYKTINHPYLTDSGTITSGERLEGFLADVGSYEDPYYQNKRESMEEENERMRKADLKAGREVSIPSQELLEQVELAGRELYHDMLLKSAPLKTGDDSDDEEDSDDDDEASDGSDDEDDEDDVEDTDGYGFKPVISSYLPDSDLVKKLGGLFRGSLSPDEGGVAKLEESNEEKKEVDVESLMDLKGRYYYDKFGFTPFDAEKHLALRKAYIEGLVWNLEYYYKGVASWEWYYPYNYGPMISDLTNVNSMLSEVSFFEGESLEEHINSSNDDAPKTRKVAGQPLRPFEQLLGCLPPSSSYLLPGPYRWLMTSSDSPLIE